MMRSMLVPTFLLLATTGSQAAVEFCLDGEFDLGARYQGMKPEPGEFWPARWCVVTESGSERVRFQASGRPNPDLEGEFTVVYLPPDRVRIVNADDPPDLDFVGADAGAEARRNRRIDPRRLIEELSKNPEWVGEPDDAGFRTVDFPDETSGVQVRLEDGRVQSLKAPARLPLRGRSTVTWNWDWPREESPGLELFVEDTLIFRAEGSWRDLDADNTDAIWKPTAGEPPREIPGENWPSRVDMRLESLAPGVHVVRNVRTGFHHMVVETAPGLVIADAPAGWMELQQIPPADLVGELGVSGLSEAMIDFLANELPEHSIHAVAITHAHDDHAGGARAFAAAGAAIHAPAEVSEFLERSLNDTEDPSDRLARQGGRVEVLPVSGETTIGTGPSSVRLLEIGAGPHAGASLGVLAAEANIFFQSDLHVPNSDARVPRPERAETECWFARWATSNLPPDTTVINSHTRVATPLKTLQAYLASGSCRTR